MCIRKLIVATAAVSLFTLVGCDRGGVTAYDVPKEAPPAQTTAPDSTVMDPHAGLQMNAPSVKWGQLPEGWTQSPQSSAMRLATFTIQAPDDKSAEVAIIPMPGFAGTDDQLVNMWRTQLGMPELTGTEAEGLGDNVEVAGGQGRIYEMAGSANGIPTRIIVASVQQEGVTFFFKLIGDDAVVTDQKNAFLGFLKGVQITTAGAMAMQMPMAAPAAPATGEKRWEAPQGWEELPATQFLLAKYRVTGGAGESADVNISMLSGDGGGTLANVNRWRGQLGLDPVDEVGLTTCTSEVHVGANPGIEVVLNGKDVRSGQPAKMLGIIIPVSSETWFFKMTGAADVVDSHKEEFLGFVRSARL